MLLERVLTSRESRIASCTIVAWLHPSSLSGSSSTFFPWLSLGRSFSALRPKLSLSWPSSTLFTRLFLTFSLTALFDVRSLGLSFTAFRNICSLSWKSPVFFYGLPSFSRWPSAFFRRRSLPNRRTPFTEVLKSLRSWNDWERGGLPPGLGWNVNI